MEVDNNVVIQAGGVAVGELPPLRKVPMCAITHVDDYMAKYGAHLGYESRRALRPLHDPNSDKPLPIRLKRPPFPAQSHAISAAIKALNNGLNSVFIIGEMGTGKTLLSMGAVEQHAKMNRKMRVRRPDKTIGHAYRCLVFCPGQLVPKWGREIMETVPDAKFIVIDKWDDVIRLRRNIGKRRPASPTFYIISRDRAKLSAKWIPVFRFSDGDPVPVCPKCRQKIVDKKDKSISPKKLSTRKHFCTNETEDADGRMRLCGEPLWSYVGENSLVSMGGKKFKPAKQVVKGAINRWEPAKYIHKHMKGFFDYLIVDEVHEEKSADSAQANALGALVAATKYQIALTGTLIGGYANHIRPLLWRLCARKMQRLGYSWNSEMPFNRDYGRIETTIYTKDQEASDSNSTSRGSKTTKSERVRPGIMPTIFGDLLMEQCVFLGLAEISENLPVLEEKIVGVDMTAIQAKEYARVEKILADVCKDMVAKGDRRLLATMLQTLLSWPDYPFDWDFVGYWDRPKDAKNLTKVEIIKQLRKSIKEAPEIMGHITEDAIEKLAEGYLKAGVKGDFVPVVKPASYDPAEIFPKEQALLDLLKDEIAQGRQCWVYVQYTGKKDVAKRIQELCAKHDIKARCLPASVQPVDREEWIAKYGRENQVIISHPKLVETGLDLFDKNGGHNFPTLIFYETGYNTFTLRQASRRSWRIGQKKRCKVFYFYYNMTMQSHAMELMGKKLTASLAMEGKFSSEGLAAMGADDGGIEMALAKKLSALEQADGTQTARAWEKIQGGSSQPTTLVESLAEKEKQLKKSPPKIAPKDALKEIEDFLAGLTIGKKN